jgi:hypothetical protein
MIFPEKLIKQWTWLADVNENIAMVQVIWNGKNEGAAKIWKDLDMERGIMVFNIHGL